MDFLLRVYQVFRIVLITLVNWTLNSIRNMRWSRFYFIENSCLLSPVSGKLMEVGEREILIKCFLPSLITVPQNDEVVSFSSNRRMKLNCKEYELEVTGFFWNLSHIFPRDRIKQGLILGLIVRGQVLIREKKNCNILPKKGEYIERYKILSGQNHE